MRPTAVAEVISLFFFITSLSVCYFEIWLFIFNCVRGCKSSRVKSSRCMPLANAYFLGVVLGLRPSESAMRFVCTRLAIWSRRFSATLPKYFSRFAITLLLFCTPTHSLLDVSSISQTCCCSNVAQQVNISGLSRFRSPRPLSAVSRQQLLARVSRLTSSHRIISLVRARGSRVCDRKPV